MNIRRRGIVCGSFLLATLLVRTAWAQVIGSGAVDLGGGRAIDVAVGSQGACAVTDAGRLVCWGNNRGGALGPIKKIDRLPPTVRPDLSDVAHVSLTSAGGCAQQRSGGVTCWGEFADASVRERPTSFGLGRDHGCGIVAGRVRCWKPAYRVPIRDPVQVSTGLFRNCARDKRGAVWCWGGTGGGLATSPGPSGVLRATRVPWLAGAVDLSAGPGQACVVLRSGAVECWQPIAVFTPRSQRIAGLDDAIAVSAPCAIRRGGGVACWGADNVARPVPNLANVAQLASGVTGICARLQTGAVVCLGANSSRELGVETQTESTTPVRVPGVDAVAVAVGNLFSCALGRDSGVTCWGAPNGLGVGTPLRPEMVRPRPLAGARDVIQLAAGDSELCALSRAGRATCWSWKLEPQPLPPQLEKETFRSIALGGLLCGVTTAGDVFCPQRVDAARGAVEAVGNGSEYGCARKPAGEVICWGTEIPKSATPVPGNWEYPPSVANDPSPHVVDIPPVRQLAARGTNLCGVFTDGRVFCTILASRSGFWFSVAPKVQAEPVRSIAVASGLNCVIYLSGRVGCWGHNDDGRLGIGKLGGGPESLERPIAPVVGLDRIVSLSASQYHACAVRADGAVFCWGSNGFAELGLGTIGFRATP